MSSIGTDGSLPTDRMARYCTINEVWAESSCFGSFSAEEVMEQMLVNDGQAHRGFRKNIFNNTLSIVGISCGKHPAGSIAQFEYAKGLLKEGQTQRINITVTDEVPDELIDKMKSLGIDTKRIQFNRKNEKPPQSKSVGVKDSEPKTNSKTRREFQIETNNIDQA